MNTLHPALTADMKAKGIDVDLALAILSDLNCGKYDGVHKVSAKSLPGVDGNRVISTGKSSRPTLSYRMDTGHAREILAGLGLSLPDSAEISGNQIIFGFSALADIGSLLMPATAYGVLNGGSATSYADTKKNMAFGPEVFESFRTGFETLAPLCRGKSKGLTPAYVNPDGSPGLSFLTLKMRARLIASIEWKKRHGRILADDRSFMPLFQMTSIANDQEIQSAFAECRNDPALSALAEEAGLDAARWLTGVQPMIAALTHSSEGRPRRIFDRAYGKSECSIALPGGHGQCFRILEPVLAQLVSEGVRFAYIGNVDNIGFVPDPVAVALLALSGKPAAFEFALRTPVDVKGGILVETEEGTRTIADIGPAISFDRVMEFEREGTPILFNCATGLFDLHWLVPRLAEISRELPTRITDQDKDAGKYSQAEQVTWEVTGILPDFLAFAVEKSERFIAAKLLAETLLTSGLGLGKLSRELEDTSRNLNGGLHNLLSTIYGMELRGNRWVPSEKIAE